MARGTASSHGTACNDSAESRYANLQLREALNRRFDYAEACEELAALLIGGYTKVPKALQAAMFEDVLVAFRLMPGLDTRKQLSAAHSLLQAADSALPKNRRFTAAREYKHAAVAQSRRFKSMMQQQQDYVPLPHDVLVHVFGFLNTCGLAAARAVCRSWRAAESHATLLAQFGSVDIESSQKREPLESDLKALVFHPNRAMCGHCNCLLWITDVPTKRQASQEKRGCNRQSGRHDHSKLRPLTPNKVLRYVISCPSSGSDSHSESDEEDEDEATQWFSPCWERPKYYFQ